MNALPSASIDVSEFKDEDDDELLRPYLSMLPSELNNHSFEDRIMHLKKVLPPHIFNLAPTARLAALDEIYERFRQFQQQEEALEQLQKYREEVVSKYQPLHSELFDLDRWPFVETFQAVIESGDQNKLLSLLKEEAPGIYSVDILQPRFCTLLLEEVEHFEHWCSQNQFVVHRPNSMNSYGAILDDFGFQSVLDQLTTKYMNPICGALYKHIGPTLDSHHAFIVEYEIGKDTKLDFHVDDSEFTLNLCLGRHFEGGDLIFGGVRCHHHQTTGVLPAEQFEFAHRVGQGLLHLGKHRHQAGSITAGQRSNLILWCRSSQFRDSEDYDVCPSWCGVHHLADQAQQ